MKLESGIIRRFEKLFGKKISAMKSRIHGDYHLGQVLYAGNDFFITDFEGERSKPVSETKVKEVTPARCSWHDTFFSLPDLYDTFQQ